MRKELTLDMRVLVERYRKYCEFVLALKLISIDLKIDPSLRSHWVSHLFIFK